MHEVVLDLKQNWSGNGICHFLEHGQDSLSIVCFTKQFVQIPRKLAGSTRERHCGTIRTSMLDCFLNLTSEEHRLTLVPQSVERSVNLAILLVRELTGVDDLANSQPTVMVAVHIFQDVTVDTSK